MTSHEPEHDEDAEPLSPQERAAFIRTIRDDVEVKEFSRAGAKYVRLTYRPTGTYVDHKCGASLNDSLAKAFDLLLDALRPIADEEDSDE